MAAPAAVLPLKFSFTVDTSAAFIWAERPVMEPSGKVRYLFRCIGGRTEFLESLGDWTGSVFGAPLTCTLSSPGYHVEYTHLAEEDTAAWLTRGAFMWEDLVGACGDYPEFGRVRTFRTRDVGVTLHAAEREIVDGRLARFRMDVSIRPVAPAPLRYTARPGYLDPRGDCSQVRERAEPRYTRRW